MINAKITGLDKLQRQLEEAQARARILERYDYDAQVQP